MFSIESNTWLLKRHMSWPERKKYLSSGTEAVEFFKYLFLNFHDQAEVEQLENVRDVEIFLEKNDRVLHARSTRKPPQPANARTEPRSRNDMEVVLNVDECDSNVEMIGITFDGRTMDMALHGMQVSLALSLPQGSIVKLGLRTVDGEAYELLAETRWVRPLEDCQLMGLRIMESRDFDLWQRQIAFRSAVSHVPERSSSSAAVETPLGLTKKV